MNRHQYATHGDIKTQEEKLEFKIDKVKMEIEEDIDKRFNSMNETIVAQINDRFLKFKQDEDVRYQEIIKLLKPIADTYTNTRTLGKWGLSFITLLALLFGSFMTIKAGYADVKQVLFK